MLLRQLSTWGVGWFLWELIGALWGVGPFFSGVVIPLWGRGGLPGVAADPGVTQAASDNLERDTSGGRVRGYLYHVTQLQAATERYFAIPYAAPPVGSLRFEPPKPPTQWFGVRNATELPPACYTIWGLHYVKYHMQDFSSMSEDCLYLNVYVPVLEQAHYPLPVLVYVHGGGNEAGMGAMLHPDVFAILAKVVVVNFNYRLADLGFCGVGEEGFRGNFGLLDQTAAMRWVKDNIRRFGGDPNKVTIQGHSAGGADVGCHVVSPLSKGLFRYAIMSSGFPLSYFGMEQPPISVRDTTLHMASALGCDTSASASYVKECLKLVSKDKMMMMNSNAAHYSYYHFVPLIVDGEFLPLHPKYLMEFGQINGQTFMLGVTANDGADGRVTTEDNYRLDTKNVLTALPPTDDVRNLPDVADLVTFMYKPPPHLQSSLTDGLAFGDVVGDSSFRAPGMLTADMLRTHASSVYFYSFDFDSELDEDVGVYHGRDLFYLWGYPFVGHYLFNYTDVDRDVSREMAALWGNFIRTGKPRPRQGTRLHPYSPTTPFYFRVVGGKNGSVLVEQGQGLRSHFVAFWNSLLPALAAKAGRKVAGLTVPYDAFTTVFICLCAVLCLALVGVSVSFYLYCRCRARPPPLDKRDPTSVNLMQSTVGPSGEA